MEVQRHDFLAFAGQSLLKDGVAGLAQPDFAVLRNDGHSRNHVESHKGLGTDEIDLAEELRGLQQLGQIGAQEICELGEDAGDLGLLVLVQLVETVVHLHNLNRLYEDSLAAGALVVHYAGDAVFVDRRHGDKHHAVPHRHSGIFLHITVALGLLEDGRSDLRDSFFLLFDETADARQSLGSVVADIAVTVYDGVDAADHLGEVGHRLRHLLKVGVDSVLAAVEESDDLPHGVEGGAQNHQSRQRDGRAFGCQRQQQLSGIRVSF